MSDLKERAAVEAEKAFNANRKRHDWRLRGVLRAECLQAAHERVQSALSDFDERKGRLSTFVRAQVDGAIKDELRRQRAVIGKPHGANYAPVSLDGSSEPRYTSDDLSAARWHTEAGIGDPAADDPDNPFAPIYDAHPVTPPGAAFGEAGKAVDRMHAPAAMRQTWREQARLDWECALSAALASEDVSPEHKETLRQLSGETEAADAYAHAVREVRPHYRPDHDAIAEAAVFHLLGVLARLKPLRVEPAPVWAADELREIVRGISDVLFEHHFGRTRNRGDVQTVRAALRAFLAADPPVPPILAAKLAEALPRVLQKAARRRGNGGQPAPGEAVLRWLWRCHSP